MSSREANFVRHSAPLLVYVRRRDPSKTDKSYVVYLGAHSHGPEVSSVDLNRVTQHHHEFLGSFMGRHINGFAAKLDDAVAAETAKHSKVVSVFLSKENKLHTTHSWEFLGLEQNGRIPPNSIWEKARYGEDIIIGNIDTGELGQVYLALAKGQQKEEWRTPKARVAAYKVCWTRSGGCCDSDIIAAFDMAIHDGVDVLSVSLGIQRPTFFGDGVAIGSFHAVQHGIVVVCSAGNNGLVDGAVAYGTVTNAAPWQIVVGASTMNRDFPNYVVLGNNKRFKGQSLSEKGLPSDKLFPLILAEDAFLANASTNALALEKGILDPKKVKGKIVVWSNELGVAGGQQAALAGAVGVILINIQGFGYDRMADPHPDITAPGENIIAAYTEAESPTNLNYDQRRIPFNSMSGTSMSCPHISGIAGLLKTLHPDWSPAAIQSAIMTTATTLDNHKQQILDASFTKAIPFSYGEGHAQPNLAMDPGLVYDLTVNDYLNFLCALGYNKNVILLFSTNSTYTCPENAISLVNFNYPSIIVPKLSGSITVTRTLALRELTKLA
ncbi:subtilisin-like protease SBT5.4 [Citrus sinensis]|nr:subtilisin-like protease SBT5.4 [Citrus sinensis]